MIHLLYALKWAKTTLILLGLVYVYQFAKINFFGGFVSYNPQVLSAEAEQKPVKKK